MHQIKKQLVVHTIVIVLFVLVLGFYDAMFVYGTYMLIMHLIGTYKAFNTRDQDFPFFN